MPAQESSGNFRVGLIGFNDKENGERCLGGSRGLGEMRSSSAKALQRVFQKEFWEFRRFPEKMLGLGQKIQGGKRKRLRRSDSASISGMKNGIHRPFREENRGARWKPAGMFWIAEFWQIPSVGFLGERWD